MFGYVRIEKPELKVREYESYRAAYCGLCRSMGKCTGCASRMTLSYDFAFLLVLRTVLAGETVETELRRCPAHPFRKRRMLRPSAESAYVACAAGLLTYYKCRDDLADERGSERLRAKALFPMAKRMRRKALKRDPALADLDVKIDETMRRIAEAEREKTPSADRYAALSGELLGEIFSFGLEGDRAAVARSVGRHFGKWIYLVDAYDDLDGDRERGRFNPYLLLWEQNGPEPSEESRAAHREMVRVALLNELAEAEKGIDLFDFCGYPDFEGVVRNVMYLGMPHTAEAVLCGKTKEQGKKKAKRDEDRA